MAKVVFLGAGRMASAIVSGLIRKQLYRPDDIACTCGDDDTGPELAKTTGIGFSRDLASLLPEADIMVLACKPQQFSALDEGLTALTGGKLVLSILAGTTLERLGKKFPQVRNLVRAMPNTPGQIGAGATAFASSHILSDADKTAVEGILGALGLTVALPESQLDAVTALSGSGPAYVFEFTKAMEEAGVALGLERATAAVLAKQTVLGSALLMDASTEDPETLRKHVTSPGGTTQAALESFQGNKLRAIVTEALTAARDRSVELSQL
ncbi:pyrroline-5-carboxylate reductase [Ruficoccus amylovorans]|uniref:Pyrroline-5-carboxylate reductase n=1 Tax=Ruficoccus amylovorans TaxID=1804625 RepID=A0A842HLL4_9BACT|nr:pyrroline-5-carboxylate reductase [Ruficoccus amylovorans]MBC2596357.1 pyrroline-5-carboxylate reductase [Ruficoccus amylovorans]